MMPGGSGVPPPMGGPMPGFGGYPSAGGYPGGPGAGYPPAPGAGGPGGSGKLTVGPIIGKVTDKTARVMAEFDAPLNATCVCTPMTGGAPVKSQPVQSSPNKPFIYKLSGLTPGTKYRVNFESSGSQIPHIDSSFKSLPPGGWKLGRERPRVAVCSCNKVFVTYKIGQEADLWRELAARVRSGEVEYFFHLGDNVYADSDMYLIEKGKAEPTEACHWYTALTLVESLPPTSWDAHAPQVVEIFRQIYRETWNHPPTKYVLANVPNIMIYDDHDIRDDFGDREVDYTPGTKDYWLARKAYDAILEYQIQLHEDVPHVANPSAPFPTRSYHFHNFGDIGVYFQDVRGCKTFHRKPGDPKPMLGMDQWAALNQALAPGGELGSCRLLLLMLPEPVAYITNWAAMLGAKYVVDDLYGSWGATPHLEEATAFMDTFFRWRQAAPGREVLLIGGDVHQGGWTAIYDTQGEYDNDLMQQLTTSAISNVTQSYVNNMAVTGMRDVTGTKLGEGGFKFRHYDWCNTRNYAIIDGMLDEVGGATYQAFLVSGNADEVGIVEETFGADYRPSMTEDFFKQACTIM